MDRVAALIPTYHRADKLADFIKNFNDTSSSSHLYFIITPDDQATKKTLQELNQDYFICDGEYVASINTGFDFTKEEFVLCAADDVVFSPGWDSVLLQMADRNPDKHVFGGVDEWRISMTQKHISHPFIRRNHFSSPLYHPEYIHYMCDIEFEQRAFLEDCVMVTPRVLIGHPHTVTAHLDQKTWDETYKRSFSKIGHDQSLFNRRKAAFEVWDFEQLNETRVIPTKLNPVYNQTLLSIVLPVYKDFNFLQRCIQSIVNNTFYRFELIIINDSVDDYLQLSPWETINYKKFLDSIAIDDQSCDVRVIHNKKQQWVNHNWNKGAALARGQYVAFLNSDITLSKDWDKYLVSALNTPTHPYTVACPFETNPHQDEPFSLDKTFRKYLPNMIKGQCFMMRKTDADKIFPIPSQIKHWCGDNWIADKAEEMNKTVFAKKAVVHHYISQSSKKVDNSIMQNRTYKDILEYEKLTGKNLEFIKKRFPDVVKNYCWVDDREYKSPH